MALPPAVRRYRHVDVNELGQHRHGKPKGGMDGAINGPHHHTFGAQAPAELGSDAVAEVAAVA